MLTLNWCKLVKGLMHVEIMIIIYPRLLFPLIFVDFLTLTHQWKTTKINVGKKISSILCSLFIPQKIHFQLGFIKEKSDILYTSGNSQNSLQNFSLLTSVYFSYHL